MYSRFLRKESDLIDLAIAHLLFVADYDDLFELYDIYIVAHFLDSSQ